VGDGGGCMVNGNILTLPIIQLLCCIFFNSIHTYTLPLSAPFAHSAPQNKLTHPRLFVNSFYVKLAASPCGNWLASAVLAEGYTYGM